MSVELHRFDNVAYGNLVDITSALSARVILAEGASGGEACGVGIRGASHACKIAFTALREAGLLAETLSIDHVNRYCEAAREMLLASNIELDS